MTKLSAPQFNHDICSAHDDPVTVTHRSEPAARVVAWRAAAPNSCPACAWTNRSTSCSRR